MILAAGRGERMRPLTAALPKPMLAAAGKPLLQYHVEALARAGVTELVINRARLGEKITAYFGDGADFGVSIRYSDEGDEPLETGGGIRQALPLLGAAPFLAVNGDVWTDFPLAALKQAAPTAAHLVLAPNPPHHPRGDFALEDGRVLVAGRPAFTFSGIGVYHPSLFADVPERSFPLARALRPALERRQVTGELYEGCWFDIGAPARLAALERFLGERAAQR